MSASGADLNGPAPSPRRLEAEGIGCTFDPACGIISNFVVTDLGHRISMMHRAPWVGTSQKMPDDAALHLARLEGDFFCAPFSDASMDGAPLHGWPANSLWRLEASHQPGTLRSTLEHKVFGATVVKDLTLKDAQPFLYQRHTFAGGQGAISAANHAMISLPDGGLLRFSPKRRFETPATPLETDPALGRSSLRYPARSADPRQFPAADGGTIDLTQFPFAPAHEDFVIALESPDSCLGWTAVTRPATRDLYISLRNPRLLPMTMLWHSNGGRDYEPWLGRHVGCLGVEEGIALPMLNITSREDPDLRASSGTHSALVLMPDGQTETRHITGCIHWPSAQAVQDISLTGDQLTIVGEKGAARTLPIDGAFLQLQSSSNLA